MSSIFRIEKGKDYTVVSNVHLRDKSLTLKAKGLLTTMLSVPEDWNYSIAGFSAICADGRDAVRSAVVELEKAGYIQREQSHASDSGKFSASIYVVYETPHPPLTGNPSTDNPTTGKPSSENPTQLSTYISNTKVLTPIAPKIAPKVVTDMLSDYAKGDAKLLEALLGFAEMRSKIRAPITTERTVELLCGKLDKLSGGITKTKIEMLDAATERNWKTVYAPKGEGGAPIRVIESEDTAEW